MSAYHENAPPGYEELRSQLLEETDAGKFRALVEQINRLLTAYEKRTPIEYY